MVRTFSEEFIGEVQTTIAAIDRSSIEAVAAGIAGVRSRRGRLFVLGVGGSAGHASHAVNDFRKICSIEAYAPTDNVSEFTARTNDDGWESTFTGWLRVSQLEERDGVLVLSVGGGDENRMVSTNLVEAMKLAKERDAAVFGIVGRDGGYAARKATAHVLIPEIFPHHVTPLTEGICAVIWHLLVTHPSLSSSSTHWESLQ